MNIRQIQCLVEAGKELNFTAAAKNLFLTQPAVSRYITSLEEELGTKLFIRKGSRKVALTQCGQVYFEFFLRSINELRSIQERLCRSEQDLRLGYPAGWNVSPFLRPVLDQLCQAGPDWSVSLTCLEFQPLLQALQEDQLDVVLTPEDYVAEKDAILELTQITIIQNVIPYSENLLNGTAHSLADFAGLDFFIPENGRAQRLCQNVLRSCAPCHFTPKLVPKANMETVMACVENGLGVAVLDEWCQILTHPGVHSFALDSRQTVCLAWKAGTEPSHMRSLQSALLDCFEQNSTMQQPV